MKVLVIGGVAGGATAATRLRRLREDAEIIVFERGPYVSFANCGLPYYVGDKIKEKDALLLVSPKTFKEQYNIEIRIFQEVVHIDREGKTVSVKNHKTGEEYTEFYDKLLISTGAEPIKPPLPGLDHEKVFTLRTVPDSVKLKGFIEENQPKHAVVVGGGYIGLEMVENFSLQGLSVALVEKKDHVVGALDKDVATEVHHYIESQDIALHLNLGLVGVEEIGDRLSVLLEDGSKIETDMVLLALGVMPESGLAKDAGLALGIRDSIAVDKFMRTTDPFIYAVGDAVQTTHFVSGAPSYIPLAGPANKQARVAADNIASQDGKQTAYAGPQGTSVLKLFEMTVATTGLNVEEAAKAGFEADSVIIRDINHASYYPGARDITLKVVYEKNTATLLGAQVVGFGGVDKRCDIIATAIRGRMTALDLTELDLSYAPPYGTPRDIVNIAGYVIENIVTGKVKTVDWDQLNQLPTDGSVTLLDVHSQKGALDPALEHFVHIPLEELRERMNELDKDKPVYVICYSGVSSYVAARILAAHGYRVYYICGAAGFMY